MFIKLFAAMTPLIITSTIIISTIMLICSKRFGKKVKDLASEKEDLQV